MSTNYTQRDLELDDETVAVLCEAVSNGDLQLLTVRGNLEMDLRRMAEIGGCDKYESEMRDLQYRTRVRRRVLAELEGGDE